MSFGLCRDCRHWAKRAGSSDPTLAHCCALAKSIDGEPMIPTTSAFARDCEQYSADLITQPDFGCVQFASSQPETESGG